jgi:uncharacterized protein YukE
MLKKQNPAEENYLIDKKKAIDDWLNFIKHNAERAANLSTTGNIDGTFSQKTKNGDKIMEISKKDLTKIMSAMKTITKHFAEEDEAKAQKEDEVTDDETTTEDDVSTENVVFELPEDVAQAMMDSLNDGIEEAESTEDEDDESTEVETEEDDDTDVDEDDDTDVDEDEDIEDTEDDEATEEDMCGDGEFCEGNFSYNDFYDFTEEVTDSIENMNKKIDKLSDEIGGKYEDEFVEQFSEKDFLKFSETVSQALDNIEKRISMLETETHKDEVTTDIDNLQETADDYEDQFITKTTDENVETTDEQVVDETSAALPEVADTETAPVADAQFSKRYEAVKNFLSGSL